MHLVIILYLDWLVYKTRYIQHTNEHLHAIAYNIYFIKLYKTNPPQTCHMTPKYVLYNVSENSRGSSIYSVLIQSMEYFHYENRYTFFCIYIKLQHPQSLNSFSDLCKPRINSICHICSYTHIFIVIT